MPKHYRHPVEMKLLSRLRGVHPENVCAGEVCVFHNPTDHHMRTWTMHWRSDRAIVERLCPEHGTGHPDPDQFPYWDRVGQSWQKVHGCCSCCLPASHVGE